ncbi:hypothetical protein Tco_0407035 [Tanacetum coccineum]
MLSKKPKKKCNQRLAQGILAPVTRSRLYGPSVSHQPVLYDLIPFCIQSPPPFRVYGIVKMSVHQVVSMKKMNEKPGHVRPVNAFYDKLNALMFVPQKELSGDQAYWLSANEIASQTSKSATPSTL